MPFKITLGGWSALVGGGSTEVVMCNGVETLFEYGGLLLTCDEEAFARLGDE